MQQFDTVFQESYARVMGEGAYNPQFIEHFYEVFLDSSPEIAIRFARTDMSRQKTMLHDSMDVLIEFSKTKLVNRQMQRLAQVHGPRSHDIPPRLYELWLDSLMQTVRAFDPDYDAGVDLAWRLTLAPGIAYLQHAYAHLGGGEG